MKRYALLGIAAVVGCLGCCTVSTLADTVQATEVQSYRPGDGVADELMNPLNALGDPSVGAGVDWPDFDAFSTSTKVPGTNQPFVTLGRAGGRTRGRDEQGEGGEIVLRFDPFDNDSALEITVRSSYVVDWDDEELAKVFVSDLSDGPWTFAGIASNWRNGGLSKFSIPAGRWKYLRVQDTTVSVGGIDGFDLNSVAVTEVPTPTAAVGGAALLALMTVPKIRKLRRKSFDMTQ